MTPSQIQLIERKNALDRLNALLDEVFSNPLLVQEYEY